MALEIGSHVGPYEITGILGKGGMGEVYRARDPRLNRDVAIKTSASRFSERFEREARAIAALNHPNICQIYDVGPNYLVMELVEGEPPKGPMDLDEALSIADQIAEALQEAHEKLITHRDLKPGNIMVTPSGVVKVLDFGLAKMGHVSVPDSENSPTLSMSMTQAGMILGTAAYMSPEQARGKPVDERADIWAFGVVLYEILTGKRLFKGEDLGDTLASVVKEQPNLSDAPERVRRLLEACLQKDPKKRLQSIGDMRLLLAEAPAVAANSRVSRLWPIAAAAGVFLGAIGLWAPWRPAPAPPEVVKFEVGPPEKGSFTNWMSLSPDGKKIAYTARGDDGQVQLWVRPLDSLDAKPITATAGNAVPFWSPDSRSIGYHLSGKLRRIDAAGGPSQALCDASTNFMGGAWSADGTILFGGPEGLQKVSANGGVAEKVTSRDESKQEIGHDSPEFLPDGRHFLYHGRAASRENAGIYVGSLDDAKLKTRVMVSEVNGLYASGFLLFERERALMAQPFDAANLKLTGEPVLLADPIGRMTGNFLNAMVSETTLIYRSSSIADVRQLTWVDREGKTQTPVTMPAAWANVRLSSDATRAVIRGQDAQGDVDVWMVDLSRALPTRFTFDKAADNYPVWSPDNSRVVFRSLRNGDGDLYWKAANGTMNEEVLLKSSENKTPTDWSRNGSLLYTVTNSKTKNDVWVLPMEGEKKPRPFLVTDFDEGAARFSPDGRFVAYQSNETGNDEVYVRSFPDGGGKWQVSKGGGQTPAWSRDGKQLFYSMSARLYAVDVTTAPAFQSSEPRTVYTMLDGGEWDVAPDGRFLVVQSSAQNAAAPIKVVLNWQAGLKK